MYWESIYGTPSGGMEADDSRNEGQAPREEEDEGIEINMEDLRWRRAGERRNPHYQHRHQYEHQGQQHQRQPRGSSSKLKRKESQLLSSSPSSPLLSTTNPPSSDSAAGDSSPGRSTVDRLARKLSKQNLQYGSRSYGQPQGQQIHAEAPSSSHPMPSLPPIVPEPAAASSSSVLEVDDQPEEPISTGPSSSHTPHWVHPMPSLDMGCNIEVDEEEPSPAKIEDKRLDFRRLRRQASASLRSATPGNLRAINARLQAMITNELQCNVRSEPVSTPSASTSSTANLSESQPASIEVDPDCLMPNWDALEVDDNAAEGCEVTPANDNVPQRYQYPPGGIRKYSVGGVTLRYRLSADAALHCQNVVKSRPRMRRRDKSRHGSVKSSAMTSAVTSAVNSPVMTPAALSSTSFPPPPPPPPPPRYK